MTSLLEFDRNNFYLGDEDVVLIQVGVAVGQLPDGEHVAFTKLLTEPVQASAGERYVRRGKGVTHFF